MNISVFPSALRIRSKSDALKFYGCVKHCIIIPCDDEYVIRVEPNRLFSVLYKSDVEEGWAWMHASTYDEDGSMAYRFRKYINAWLAR